MPAGALGPIKVTEPPSQNVVEPVAAIVAVGRLLTVTVVVVVFVQPPGVAVTVYVIVAVPTALPVTTPDEFTLAIVLLEELQTPPDTELLSDVLELIHTDVVPEIVPALGKVFKVSTATSLLVPQPFDA